MRSLGSWPWRSGVRSVGLPAYRSEPLAERWHRTEFGNEAYPVLVADMEFAKCDVSGIINIVEIGVSDWFSLCTWKQETRSPVAM